MHHELIQVIWSNRLWRGRRSKELGETLQDSSVLSECVRFLQRFDDFKIAFYRKVQRPAFGFCLFDLSGNSQRLSFELMFLSANRVESFGRGDACGFAT